MRRDLLGLIAALMLLAVSGSCSRDVKVLSPSKMSKIYADMLMADQWLEKNPECRAKADTSLFYEAVFRKYGCTFTDFDSSVRFYMRNPEKYYFIFDKTHSVLEQKLVKLNDEVRKEAEEEMSLDRSENLNEENRHKNGKKNHSKVVEQPDDYVEQCR